MNNAKPEAVYLNRIFIKWHHMDKEFWRFNKGTNGIYRFINFFYTKLNRLIYTLKAIEVADG